MPIDVERGRAAGRSTAIILTLGCGGFGIAMALLVGEPRLLELVGLAAALAVVTVVARYVGAIAGARIAGHDALGAAIGIGMVGALAVLGACMLGVAVYGGILAIVDQPKSSNWAASYIGWPMFAVVFYGLLPALALGACGGAIIRSNLRAPRR